MKKQLNIALVFGHWCCSLFS